MFSLSGNPTIKISFKFKEHTSLETRKSESAKILAKYPERIPVIVQKLPGSDIADLDKHKFLRALPPSSALMSTIYDEFKDEDGFLYVAYSGESTFGN